MSTTPTLPVESKELTKSDVFKPTPAMRIWLDTAIDIVSDSPTDIAEKSQLSRAVWYEWLKIPEFEDWYYGEYKKARRRWLPTLDRIGMGNAKKDYNYWKDMKATTGDAPIKEPSVAVQVNNVITEKKQEYGI